MGAMPFGVAVIAGPDRASRNEFDDGCKSQLAAGFGVGQMLRNAAADFRQGLGEPYQSACFASLAHVLPSRVIAILMPPGSVAPDCLQMGGGICSIAHVVIGRRNG
jgi:hypothetical protein